MRGYLTKAVDTVRKAENRALAVTGDRSLAGSKYLWLYSAENLPARHQDRFAVLRGADLKPAMPGRSPKDLRHFWSYKRRRVTYFGLVVQRSSVQLGGVYGLPVTW
ncbi:MAG: hypothetical protein SV966_07880 [Actinomycetota bacterium]|nr:hypothetical protein [Actinomycetota bacterium]